MTKYNLWMNDIVFFQDKIFFSAGQFNGLFMADLRDGKAEFLATFPKEPRLQARLHSVAINYKNEIIFLPDLSNYITIYNIEKKDFINIKYPIENRNELTQYCPKIVAGILIDSCVYAFSSRDPCIISYNFETKKLRFYNEWFEKFKMYGYEKSKSFFCRDIVRLGDSILARTYQNNVIVDYNMKTEEISFHRVDIQTSIILWGDVDKIWLIKGDGTSVYKWNNQEGLIETAEIGNVLERDEKAYQCSIKMGDEIWLFPFFGDSIAIMDAQSKETKKIFTICSDGKFDNKFLGAVWFRKIYNNRLYFMSVLENKIYCVENSEKEILRTNIYIDRLTVNKYLLQEKKNNDYHFPKLIKEDNSLWGDALRVDDFLNLIVLHGFDAPRSTKEEKKIGMQIYKVCIEGLERSKK